MEDIQKQVDGVVLTEAMGVASAALLQLVPMLWQYYEALVKAGFTVEQALALTVEAQTLALTGRMGKGNEG